MHKHEQYKNSWVYGNSGYHEIVQYKKSKSYAWILPILFSLGLGLAYYFGFIQF